MISSFLIMLTSCQTPYKYNLENQGHWESKALIKDKVKSKNYIVKIDSYLKNIPRLKKLRVEVSSPFGDLLGVVLMNNNSLEIALPEQRKYYKGPAKASALKPLLSISLDPNVFFSIFFDIPIRNKNWTCTTDTDDFLSECINMNSKIKIKWTARRNVKKTIYIQHKKVDIQLNVRDFSPELKDEKTIFQLKVPKAYKKISL